MFRRIPRLVPTLFRQSVRRMGFSAPWEDPKDWTTMAELRALRKKWELDNPEYANTYNWYQPDYMNHSEKPEGYKAEQTPGLYSVPTNYFAEKADKTKSVVTRYYDKETDQLRTVYRERENEQRSESISEMHRTGLRK